MAYASGKAKAGETKYSYTDWECLTIRKASNGGFIVQQSLPMKAGKYVPDPKPLVFEDANSADELIDKCMGVTEKKEPAKG